MSWKVSFQKQLYKVPTIILEAITLCDVRIWYAFFGLSRSLNYINILNRSLIFQELYENWAPKCEYVINEYEYKIGYYLSDEIYPKWATFVVYPTFPMVEEKTLHRTSRISDEGG